MIFLLYKPIIGLGPCFAPAPDAGHMFFVALTAQANNGTQCLNRIYRLTANALISLSSARSVRYSSPFPSWSLPHGALTKAVLAPRTWCSISDGFKLVAGFLCAAALH
jgi:hypothetical protein